MLFAARLPSLNKALKLSFRLPSATTIASVGLKSFNRVVKLSVRLSCGKAIASVRGMSGPDVSRGARDMELATTCAPRASPCEVCALLRRGAGGWGEAAAPAGSLRNWH